MPKMRAKIGRGLRIGKPILGGPIAFHPGLEDSTRFVLNFGGNMKEGKKIKSYAELAPYVQRVMQKVAQLERCHQERVLNSALELVKFG